MEISRKHINVCTTARRRLGILFNLSLTHLADYVIDGVGEEEVAGRLERDAKWLPNAGADGRPIVPHGLPVV